MEGGGLGRLDRGWVILLDRWYLWPTVIVEGGGLGGLGRWWGILLNRWFFFPTVIVEGGGLGGLGRGWVILLDRWYFWATVPCPVDFELVFVIRNIRMLTASFQVLCGIRRRIITMT